MMYGLIFVLVAVPFIADARKLPSYITACRREDPNLSECARKSAIAALPSILKGDREFKYPKLTPLRLPLVDIKPSDRLSITLKDIVLRGLETADIRKTEIDLSKRHVSVTVAFSRLNIICEYNIDGQIMVLPIKGNGPANMTFDDLVVNYSFDYILSKKNDGKLYIDSDIKPTVTFTLGKPYFHFENLFGGDTTLGDRMNEFLNEHGDEVGKDLGEPVSQTINAVVTNILKGIVGVVPYDLVFPQ